LHPKRYIIIFYWIFHWYYVIVFFHYVVNHSKFICTCLKLLDVFVKKVFSFRYLLELIYCWFLIDRIELYGLFIWVIDIQLLLGQLVILNILILTFFLSVILNQVIVKYLLELILLLMLMWTLNRLRCYWGQRHIVYIIQIRINMLSIHVSLRNYMKLRRLRPLWNNWGTILINLMNSLILTSHSKMNVACWVYLWIRSTSHIVII